MCTVGEPGSDFAQGTLSLGHPSEFTLDRRTTIRRPTPDRFTHQVCGLLMDTADIAQFAIPQLETTRWQPITTISPAATSSPAP